MLEISGVNNRGNKNNARDIWRPKQKHIAQGYDTPDIVKDIRHPQEKQPKNKATIHRVLEIS